MNTTTEGLAVLNTIEYLYLREISEPRDNALRIVVQEAVSNRAKSRQLEIPGTPGEYFEGNAWPIESTDACKTVVLEWRRYVAYLVTEEGVGSCGNYADEVFTGKLLRKYTKSHFLDHVARDTGGHFETLQHFKIICLNHLIDVVSTAPPEVQILSADAEGHPRQAVQ